MKEPNHRDCIRGNGIRKFASKKSRYWVIKVYICEAEILPAVLMLFDIVCSKVRNIRCKPRALVFVSVA